MAQNGFCPSCHKPASSLILVDGDWICRVCASLPVGGCCSLVEYETLTPDTKASKAHIKDIKSRRLDTKTGKMYYEKGKTSYFYG